MARTPSSVPLLLILSFSQVEGKCKCVDYDRDWYVVVASFTSGIVLSAILAVLLICYCKRCNRPSSLTTQSQEALESQESGDINPFYEEVPSGGNSGFEAVGSFQQTRSDSMDSRTNLVVHHGKPMKRSYYQHPRIRMEPIYSDCGVVDGKSNGQSGSGDCRNKYGEPSGTSRYQQPRTQSNYTYSDMTVVQSTNALSESDTTSLTGQLENTWSECSIDHEQETALMVTLPTETTVHHGDTSNQGDYQQPNHNRTRSAGHVDMPVSPTLPPKYNAISPNEPTSEIGNHQRLEMVNKGKSIPLKPPRKIKKSTAAPTDYQTPSQQLVTPPSKRVTKTPSPELVPSSPSSDPAADGKSREVTGKEFLENDCKSTVAVSSTQDLPTPSKSEPPSPSLDPEAIDRDANCQLPEIDVEFLENEGHRSSDPQSNRDAGYQIPNIDKAFLESEEKLSSQSSCSQPIRTPSQKSIAAPSMAPTSLVLPDVPARPPSEKSPSPRTSMTSIDSSWLPTGTPSVKSSDTAPSISQPAVPPKTVPALPLKTREVPPPSTSLYSELNELDRQDDTLNHEHLTPTSTP